MDPADVRVEGEEEPSGPRSTVAKVGIGVVGTLASLLLLWGAAHLFIPPISPEHTAPAGHFSGQCWTCHLMTAAPPTRSE